MWPLRVGPVVSLDISIKLDISKETMIVKGAGTQNSLAAPDKNL